MKTVFIVNPKAGKKKDIEKFISQIMFVSQKLGAEILVYETKTAGDAELFVKKYCCENGAARFIACGGDGTLNEVVNGAAENGANEVGVVPLGTGNDFCRNFGDECEFLNIALQIEGESTRCDLIRYKTKNRGANKVGYCANMFNIGFDCNVVDMTDQIKKRTFLRGPFAYFAAIFVTLIKKKGANLKIEVDGEEKHNGKLLLTSVANGSYCGGGVKSNPLANINNDLININIVKNVSRLNFISLLPHYMRGTFLELKRAKKVISSLECKKIVITPIDSEMRICIDGEIFDAGKTEFEIVHNAFNFVVPKDLKNVEQKRKCLVL